MLADLVGWVYFSEIFTVRCNFAEESLHTWSVALLGTVRKHLRGFIPFEIVIETFGIKIVVREVSK